MSCLKWQVDVYLSRGGDNKAAPTTYWALWHTKEDQTAWYNMPRAEIRKIKDRQWELTIDGADHVRRYTTLKAAKAMGIVLTQMEN